MTKKVRIELQRLRVCVDVIGVMLAVLAVTWIADGWEVSGMIAAYAAFYALRFGAVTDEWLEQRARHYVRR